MNKKQKIFCLFLLNIGSIVTAILLAVNNNQMYNTDALMLSVITYILTRFASFFYVPDLWSMIIMLIEDAEAIYFAILGLYGLVEGCSRFYDWLGDK